MNYTLLLPFAVLCFALMASAQEAMPDSGILAVAPAPNMTVRDKFVRCSKATFGPVALLTDAAGAGYDQVTNTPGPWGQGAAAYSERFASQFGISFVDESTEFALASALHEDPRYYPSLDPSFKARLKSAFKQTLIKRKDSGGPMFAYAEFGGALAGGFASNAWLPRTDNSAADALETAAVLMARDLSYNLAREFIPFFHHIQ